MANHRGFHFQLDNVRWARHRSSEKYFERKIVIIFLPINLYMCFGCAKEPSHRDGSFEYPQHLFWLRNKKNNFPLRTLIWRPGSVGNVFISRFRMLVQ